jgi:outer membrane protein
MKSVIRIIILVLWVAGISVHGQDVSPWTLQKCIDYALNQNIQVRQSYLTNESYDEYIKQANAERLPSLGAVARENFGWNKNQTAENGQLQGSNGTSYSLNSSVILFNSMKINKAIKQAMLNYESSKYNSEAIKESVSLTIMNAYLQILYAEELVTNSRRQIESTSEQLALAQERLALSVISQSDYLQVKSELANEKLTLANAISQRDIARVNLMQLMEMPVKPGFQIVSPNLDSLVDKHLVPDAQEIFNTAVGIKPQIKSASLNKESTAMGIKLARADYLPYLTFNAAIGTGYSSLLDLGYTNQLNNKINPTLAFSLNIPIYQNRSVKTRVAIAEINVKNAELNEINTRNQLRKSIEQASVDVMSAQSQFEASLDQYDASSESYALATEKFNQGMINSVDFLIQKTNQIVAESKLLQSKYNLIFSYKILDFYIGNPLTL